LKQQLQREQLLQEAERKEAERKAMQQQKEHLKKQDDSKVPLQSIDVDVPPQILQVSLLMPKVDDITDKLLQQVRTKLANPTRYHVIQKQKNQVKQFLSESFKSTDQIHNLIPKTVLQHSQQMTSISQPATTCNSPMSKSNTNFRLLNHISSRSANGSMTSHDMLNGHQQQHLQHNNQHKSLEYQTALGPAAGSTSSLPFLFQQRFGNITASPSEVASAAMSPTISSVATSVTSASEVSRDLLHSVLCVNNFRRYLHYVTKMSRLIKTRKR